MGTMVRPTGADDAATPPEDEEAGGPQDLLTLPEPVAAKRAAGLWTALDDPFAWYVPTFERNRLSRKGIRGVRIVGKASARDDTDGVWVPPGASENPPVPNNVDQLVRRIVDTLTADPPKIEAVAPTAEDADLEAAEQATRVLESEDREANLRAVVQKTLNRAGTFGSAFSFQYVDPYGERNYHEVLAHPAATDPENPLVDPASGMPAQQYEPKYVRTDPQTGVKTLQNEKGGADLVWFPKIREELLRPHCVRFLPATAEGIADAEGVFVGRVTTLGALKGLHESVAKMDPKALKRLVAWRPAIGKRFWTPLHLADATDKAADAIEGSDGERFGPGDDTPVYVRTLYYKACRQYPRGLVLVLGADDQVLHREVWSATVGEGAEQREESLDLPVAQHRFFDDPNDGNPYGISPVEWLAPMDEAVATQTVAWLEYLFRFNHPNTFLPLGSPIQPGALTVRDGSPIFYDPATGKPEYEAIPPFPGEAGALLDKYEGWMRTLSGLENAARGVADPSVKSGIHAERIIEQALVALTQVVSNTEDFLLRRGRIRLQLIAVSYTAPRLLSLNGNGGLPQVKAFQGADLRGVRSVRLTRNSMTMLTRSAKVAMLREELEIAMKSGDPTAYLRYRNGVMGLVDAITTADDDPHAQRVQRQLSQWQDGPNGGSDPAQIWAALPVDTAPDVAPNRAFRLGRAIASDRFTRFPPEWNQPLVAAYEQARQAAGMLNAQEQQQMQAQAQQAQAQAQGQQAQAEAQAKAQEAEAKQAGEITRVQVQAQEDRATKLAVEEMRAATRAAQPVMIPEATGEEA
jgi:hypothetical protein